MTSKLPLDQFSSLVKTAPLCSIDIVICSADKYFLCRRKNRPAKGFLFTPGGRIFKNERMAEALERIVEQELGLKSVSKSAEFVGVFEHFYNDSFLSEDITTHYLCLAYMLRLPEPVNFLLDDQHKDSCWLSRDEMMISREVHTYVKEFLDAIG